MYKIEKSKLEEIINYLNNAIVPASVGANLIGIATVLSKLEEIKETPVQEVKVPSK